LIKKRVIFIKKYCVRKLWCEKQVNKPICKLAQAYLDRVRLLCVYTLEAQEVTNGVANGE
jgi:hypothetical protein